MKNLRSLLLVMVLLPAACVQTGPTRGEPDYEEAARVNTQLGLDYLRKDRLELAQEKLEKALQQDSRQAATHMGLALVHARYNEHEESARYFERALRLAPDDPGILNNYGAYLCDRGQPADAEAYFLRAAQSTRYDTPEVAYTNAGVCYRRNGRLDNAEAMFRKALEIKPRHGPALLQLASVNYRRGDYLRARAFIQRHEAVRDATVESLLLGLRIEHALGADDIAQRYAQRLLALDPTIERRIDLKTGEAL